MLNNTRHVHSARSPKRTFDIIVNYTAPPLIRSVYSARYSARYRWMQWGVWPYILVQRPVQRPVQVEAVGCVALYTRAVLGTGGCSGGRGPIYSCSARYSAQYRWRQWGAWPYILVQRPVQVEAVGGPTESGPVAVRPITSSAGRRPIYSIHRPPSLKIISFSLDKEGLKMVLKYVP